MKIRRLVRKTCPRTGGSWFVKERLPWAKAASPDDYAPPLSRSAPRPIPHRPNRTQFPDPTPRLEMDDPERAQLYAEVRAVGYCARCGSRRRLTVDHIVPLQLGGGNHRDNLQCLCKPCNVAKGLEIWAPPTRRAA